ncbi:MAG: sensor histidine kinase N-terminal domain-containing protein [Burkholderiaceae bacterium]|nr:sensor histidine kinase N-terminal domain-containing protein [Burkholderiaceae bacterium]
MSTEAAARRRGSLRTQLLLWLSIPLAAFIVFGAWVAYRNANDMATVVQDRMLLGSARTIAEQVRFEDGTFQVIIPPAALELFHGEAGDRVYYRITGPRGVLLSGSADLAAPAKPVAAEDTVYFESSVRGEPVRIAAFSQPIFGVPGDNAVLIEVGQTLQGRGELAFRLWSHAVRQQALILLLAIVLVWYGLWRGLRPLLRLSEQVRRRTPGKMEPIEVGPVPGELAPLVAAIEDYEHRLDEHMSAHDRFIANAAHQLRTPLTVLNTQVSYASRCEDGAEKDEALRAIGKGVQHGIHLVNQLLTLSNAEAGTGRPLRQSDVDLVDVVQHALEDLAPLAQFKHIDLGMEHEGGTAMVRVASSMLGELVSNLLDNAIRYTPEGGIVTAIVSANAGSAVLRIEDNGPGIPADQRERVFERFYRLRQDTSDGWGLGLPIVREIAHSCGATVTLSDRVQGSGLVVTVAFPAIGVDALDQ